MTVKAQSSVPINSGHHHPAAGTPAPGMAYAWYVVFVLAGCYALSFIDRQILSIMVGPIKRDLHISDTLIGLLQGLAFSALFTVLGLPFGRIADTYNRRNLIAGGLVVWSVFTAACAGAASFRTLFLARLGVGVGEATLSPSAYSMIADYFPRKKLGAALSLNYMGVFWGTSLAMIVGGTILDRLSHIPVIDVPMLGALASWRVTFLIVAAPSILFVAALYTIREPIRKALMKSASGNTKLTIRETLHQVGMRWKSVAGICFGMISQAMCFFSFMAWAPTFFIRVHHWTPGQVGRALGFVILIFGCAGMWVGGWLCDRWQHRGVYDGPLRVGVPAAFGIGGGIVMGMLSSNPNITLACSAVAVFCLGLPMGTAAAALQLIFPNQLRGQITALYLFGINIGGLTLGPLLPGVFNDFLFHDEKMIGPSLAMTAALGSTLMLIIFAATFKPFRRDYEAAHAEHGDHLHK